MMLEPTFGMVFKDKSGNEYGIIRQATPPFPEELSNSVVLAEDSCGNYFVLINKAVTFWDHETSEITVLAKSVQDFIPGCTAPEAVVLSPGQVESVWVDPEFAKALGIKQKT